MRLKLKIGWWGISVVLIVVLALVLVWFFIFGISIKRGGAFFNKGHNAVWIDHDWVGKFKSDSEILSLVNVLKKNQIDTVFVHAGPLGEDGTIAPETYKHAVNFVDKARAFDGGIKYQAWLGQIRNKLDLGDKNVRHNIVKQTLILSRLVGFDGIHFDIEPIWDRDMDFIALMRETRENLAEGKVISVAMAEFIPNTFIWMMENFHEFKNYNTQVNYKNVAEYADQLVVMAYDTNIKTDWLYRWLVKEQTIWLTGLLEDKEVFIGIPAYDEAKENFDPQVENVENGLKGIIDGLNNVRSEEENFAGVAIYPYWQVDEEEWGVYENLWLKK